MTPTVKRSDISLNEVVLEDRELTRVTPDILATYWVAELKGCLSTGEEVSMYRSGNIAGVALKNLENAISDQGWRIEG